VLDFKNGRSLGLSPLGLHTAEIAPGALMDLLKVSRAKLVILATCGSSTLGLEKLKAPPAPAIIVTNSGHNLLTISTDWGQALQHFLLLLIDYQIATEGKEKGQPVTRKKGRATISEALDAANAALVRNDSEDRFELACGNDSTVVFPE
jgi:hypothetical protein